MNEETVLKIAETQLSNNEERNIITIWDRSMKELLKINSKGEVIAPNLESATEAGKIFVESIRKEIEKIKQGVN